MDDKGGGYLIFVKLNMKLEKLKGLRMKTGIVMFMLISFLLCLAFFETESPVQKVRAYNFGDRLLIKESDFGDEWPLTVQQAILKCLPHLVVTVEVNGTGYALNGNAHSRLKKFNLKEIDEIWKDDPKWKNEPIMAGIKVSVGPLISRGLKLCDLK